MSVIRGKIVAAEYGIERKSSGAIYIGLSLTVEPANKSRGYGNCEWDYSFKRLANSTLHDESAIKVAHLLEKTSCKNISELPGKIVILRIEDHDWGYGGSEVIDVVPVSQS